MSRGLKTFLSTTIPFFDSGGGKTAREVYTKCKRRVERVDEGRESFVPDKVSRAAPVQFANNARLKEFTRRVNEIDLSR